ncbi:MAG: DNA polymerase III subunit delta [Candidatus Doudnabacteria bacterium RIFCSPLOWO2_02_FULL_42_9]|uniref:DNA polymerase III subunit delta n=1 Tax=Candidatus Doudnabacteria bacterium RIFCSPHIGHO2_01_FULL_41_86 TaxID=1817821 RepID=A0A1F5N9L4_9BACT|nr:MAG: DNA polymerase III subunit delta [Candidatus Doudnabacteria bacterium RIFCSPHIGHO2_01_FULL_41_86]OGE75568.1 MAG: DNA polymerase III subunit delta [Candidatus Doudnabacteria bacterium RIFCSPHIGHO2_01_43_10]OGE85364.1 MAG: DNA polymerase III subunit delta [Candidatus Doudnabacteria bacterium RIFCSPHIGHO2_12_FULL_42_22]OGE86902.1 MAG: DNA polymerase III subunit delta [Candidatus Doudnabacteria bacterium RIFCSPHIGHO2_02_FULL_42_25]OGE92501.1 MAG: DNA polymerase III subunit delta [Candidatus
MTDKSQPSSNVFLFYGEDQFSVVRKIDHWKKEFAKKYSVQALVQIEGAELAESDIIKNLQTHLSPSLFATKKLIIVRDGLPAKATQTELADFLLNTVPNVAKDFFVVFWQTTKPDGRLGFTKKFNSKVTVNEFNLPQGAMLNQWIKAMTKTLGGSITDRAADKLAQYLGRDLSEDKKPVYNLWQVYSELLKLTTMTDQVDIDHVESLVKPKIPDSVFNLSDQVVQKNRAGAFQALENYLNSQTMEEKTALIKVIGLLAEQLRSLLMVSLLSREGLTNQQMAEKLDWTEGRVFITARNLRQTSESVITRLLSQLLVIDYKIKTSDTNQKLELNLFLATI